MPRDTHQKRETLQRRLKSLKMRLKGTHGIIVLDKPAGLTSRRAAEKVRMALGAVKAGHTGTLDPLATGVLVVCLGRATLLSSYLAGEKKQYLATAVLGITTDSYDIEGVVVREEGAEAITREQVASALKEFSGSIIQTPPPFSAVKHRGKPLYHYARKGEAVEAEARPVSIFSISLESMTRFGNRTLVDLQVTCGPGTYVRSLVNDLGRILGCGACLVSLRRTRSGAFGLAESVKLYELVRRAPVKRRELVVTMERATDWMPTAVVGNEGESRVRCGRPLTLSDLARTFEVGADPFRVVNNDGELLAIYVNRGGPGDAPILGSPARVIRPAGRAE
mgnify:CR=1 FL=1